MGYIRHHAIIVSVATDKDLISTVHNKAMEVFGPQVSNVVSSVVNNTKSFFIGPDGSKEGWSESDEGDEKRTQFLCWLADLEYEDGSSPVKWAEVVYHDDGLWNGVTASSDMRYASRVAHE